MKKVSRKGRKERFAKNTKLVSLNEFSLRPLRIFFFPVLREPLKDFRQRTLREIRKEHKAVSLNEFSLRPLRIFFFPALREPPKDFTQRTQREIRKEREAFN